MELYFNEKVSVGLEREFPKALIGWYAFVRGKRILFVCGGLAGEEAVYEALQETGNEVRKVVFEEVASACREKYDYVVGFGVLEKVQDPASFLAVLKELLTPGGRILLGLENRLGIRYFAGDKDAFAGRCFDSIENYVYADEMSGEKRGRAYSKAEMERMLEVAGLKEHRFYSVLPALENPRMLFAEDCLPEEELDIRVDPQYRSPATVLLDTKCLYRSLIDNGLFHTMANGYLLEICPDGTMADAKTVTSSLDRGREYAAYTIITRGNTVIKKAAFPEGEYGIAAIAEHHAYLAGRGIATVSGELAGNVYKMPYIQAPTATEYLRKLFWQDRERFLRELDRFMEKVDASSEIASPEEVDWERFDPDWKDSKADDPAKYKWRDMAYGTETQRQELGPIFKKGYIDLVCLNCFVIDGEYVFFDQEFVMENIPVKAIKSRTIHLLYDREMEKVLPITEALERYGLLKLRDLWIRYEARFLNSLRNWGVLRGYYNQTQIYGQTVAINRNRLNYSETEYDRIFRDIFRDIAGKELYLFGSGRFAEKFLSRYVQYLEIKGIVDNNAAKQGTEVYGLPVISPRELCKEDPAGMKVFICIKRYENVLRQLTEMGISNVSVFNPDAEYDRPMVKVPCAEQQVSGDKRYSVGYISGVFDLFHLGHVNLLRRAKEQCEHLIVGIVTDEQVMKNKKTTPQIPFEQRKAVVAACRYADEVVTIPPDAPGPEEAYRRYHFDVQFSGSDYENDPYWISWREWLRERGADMIFFPYTKETSTTAIKERLKRNAE